MKTTIILTILAAMAATAVPASSAAPAGDGVWSAGTDTTTFERRKKRVKGGSGCDDPRDVLEHAECR